MDEPSGSSKIAVWEVHGGEEGAEITRYCFNADEVLDLCGRLFYANPLFRVSGLQIRGPGSGTEMDSPLCTEWEGKTYKWLLKARRGASVGRTGIWITRTNFSEC